MATILEKAKQSVEYDRNPKTKDYVAKLVASAEAGSTDANTELQTLFGSKLKFGTSGIRAPMRPGSSSMNDLVIIQAAQGLAHYLLADFPEAKSMGVLIGFDHRAWAEFDLSSRRFAEVSAAVLIHMGFRVYFYPDFVHTPMVAFGTKHLGCKAGIMVTASHNPKEDDGYKVYWTDGATIVEPHDGKVVEHMYANMEPHRNYYDMLPTLQEHELCSDPTATVLPAYMDAITAALCRSKEANSKSDLKIVYSAMHGVGTPFMIEAFDKFGHNKLVMTDEQIKPDPTFPTVPFPNPEERGALALAIKRAEAENATLVLANDPDADRLAVAEKQPNGEWHQLSGNEIGTLLAAWEWQEHKKSGKQGPVAVVASVVSSRFLEAMGSKEGFELHGTYTGFKWLCGLGIELETKGYTVLLTYEQSIGFCLRDCVRDKDGVSAGGVFAEMAVKLRSEGKTAMQWLMELYDAYGYFHCEEGYVIASPEPMARAFERFRKDANYVAVGSPLFGKLASKFDGMDIVNVTDFTIGYDMQDPNHVAPLVAVPGTQHIRFILANGSCVTIRGSGTEPKLKFYVEAKSDTLEKAKNLAIAIASLTVFEILEPDSNGFKLPDNTQVSKDYY